VSWTFVNAADFADRACWEQNINVSDEMVLARLLDEAGYDSKSLLQRASADHIKDGLRTITNEAFHLGICGVPTYRLFEKADGEWKLCGLEGGLIWGQDELGVVEDLIAGWRQINSDVGGYGAKPGGEKRSRL
jgi:2-hydroxychromene-2-carboxylate isomerase